MAHGTWTEVEARGVLAALEKSGLSIEKFAAERGITPQRIYWWKKKFAEQSKALALLPVRVVEKQPRGEPVTVLLRCGHMVKVSHDFDEDAFARVVALLEGNR